MCYNVIKFLKGDDNMPIIIPKDIPAYNILKDENIFVMSKKRADSQDIRPIDILILNLMPTKIQTETQLCRLLANSSLQVNLTLISPKSHESKNTSASHLDKFYATFDEIKENDFNLNIPRYVDTFEEEAPVDIPATCKRIAELTAELSKTTAEMEKYLKELGV